METNYTALQMSIQRKKDRIKELEFEQRALRNFSEVPIMQNSVSDRIKLLNELISEDEKLLPTDREQTIQFAVNNCLEIGDSIDFRHTAEFLYNEKHGSDE